MSGDCGARQGKKYCQTKEQKDAKAAGLSLEELRKDWHLCHYFMRKKRQLCTQRRESNSANYCIGHTKELTLAAAARKDRKRVPCPHDPTHSVYTHKLQQHLVKCRSLMGGESVTGRPYYRKGCNSGRGLTDVSSKSDSERISIGCDGVVVDSDALLRKVETLYATFTHELLPLSDLEHVTVPEAEIVKAVNGEKSSKSKIRHALQDVLIVKQLVTADLLSCGGERHFTAQKEDSGEEMNTRGSRCSGVSTRSLMEIRAENEADIEADTRMHNEMGSGTGARPKARAVTTYVELGAGNGLLGLAVTTALLASDAAAAAAADYSESLACGNTRHQLVLVERAGSKKNGDRQLVSQRFQRFIRVRMDLRDCRLDQLPGVGAEASKGLASRHSNSRIKRSDCNSGGGGDSAAPPLARADRVVLLAKHLCGVATDISLRGVATFSRPLSKTSEGESSDGVVSSQLAGVAIATCCHHACSWVDYVGFSFLSSEGISAAEYEVLKKWSGWAHCFHRQEDMGAIRSEDSVDGSGGVNTDQSPEHADVMYSHGYSHLDEPASKRSKSQPHTTSHRPAEVRTRRDMSRVGGMVKRILDQGRVLYLRSLGLEARQVQYCEPSLSPECFMIIATQPGNKTVNVQPAFS